MGEVLEKSDNLDCRAVEARKSKDEMERLIVDFMPFLHSRAAKYSSRTNESWHEELFSAAMMAFYEAIQNYNIEKGHFFPFVNRVIYVRIIDTIRKTYKHKEHVVPLEEPDDESSSAQSAVLEKISTRAYDEENRQTRLLEEINQFQLELTDWGITLEALSKHSPKHKKQREAYRMLLSQIFQALDIVQIIHVKHYFPVKAIAEITGLSPKKLERARIYILAALIIKNGDYDILSEYIDSAGGKLY